MPWVTIANVRGPRGLQGIPGDLSIKDGAPFGHPRTWYGPTKVGIYKLPTYAVVDAIDGRPDGAKPGTVEIIPVDANKSNVTWRETGENPNVWDMVAAASGETSWVKRAKPRRVGIALTCAQGGNAVTRATSVAHALPITPGATMHRWRVHIRNFNDRTNNAFTGALTFSGIAVGEMNRTPSNNPYGAYIPDRGKVIVSTGAKTPENGDEYISPWVTDFPLYAQKDYVIRYGYTGPAQDNVLNEGGGWSIDAGALSVFTPNPAMTQVQRSPLDVWIEGYVDPGTPIIAGFGDSLTVGVYADLPVYDSWLSKIARDKGGVPLFYAHSGTGMSEWQSDLPWKVHKYMNSRYEMDRPDVLYWAMGSNDVFNVNHTFLELVNMFKVTHGILTEKTTKNVVLLSILPRRTATIGREPMRKQWNDWLRMNLPGSALYFVDAAEPLTTADGSYIIDKYCNAAPDIHLTTAGYARFATAISGGHVGENLASNKTTGWRTADLINGWTGAAEVRRENNMVTLRLTNLNGYASTGTNAIQLPPGFQIRTTDFLIPHGVGAMRLGVNGSAQAFLTQTYVQGAYKIEIKFTTEDAWPAP